MPNQVRADQATKRAAIAARKPLTVMISLVRAAIIRVIPAIADSTRPTHPLRSDLMFFFCPFIRSS